jgi:peptide/nickel transport system substrate-binding protein
MTIVNEVGTNDPTNWDIGTTTTGSVTSVYINPYLEPYFCGDINQFGPRGNDEDGSFTLPTYIPNQYLMGNIAQSWSFQENPLSLTITLKQGIMWTGNSTIGMVARELTAADCAASATRQYTAPGNVGFFGTWIKDCVVVSPFVFKYDFSTYDGDWPFFLLYGGGLAFPQAPESIAAGASNWRNAVGTGPFILSDFVDGSSVTYTRNPNYWGTATINGKQYQEPLINTLVYLIIPDPSTQIAALQSGKLDLNVNVPYIDATTLAKQTPNLIQEKYFADSIYNFRANRLASGNPLGNLQVRQALFMATDFNSIATDVYGGGDILAWPVCRGNPSYTPLEDESSQIQTLFNYNPTQAKQMLAAAGYPNGFTTTLSIDSSIAQEADDAQIIASDWAQIGVTVNIQALNRVALVAIKNSATFAGYLAYPIATANVFTPLQWFQNIDQGPTYGAAEQLNIEATTALDEPDSTIAQTDVTQFCKDALLDCGFLPMTNPYVLNCYWPWLENYYGEVDAAYQSQIPMIRELWINESLKTSLGH